MKKLIPLVILGGFLAAITIGCGPAATSAPTSDKAKPETAEYKFVEAPKEGKLTVKDKDDKDKTFDVKDVKDVKWDDFKKDEKLSITTTDGKVTKVEAKK
jgi:hypothetical protein